MISQEKLLNLPNHNTVVSQVGDIRQRFSQLAKEHGENPALGGINRPWLNYHQLNKLIQDRGNTLLDAGIGRGNIVIISLNNGPEALSAILSVASVAIALPVNPQEPVKTLERLLERVPVKAVIYEDNRQNIWKTLAKTHGLTQLPIKIAPQTPAGCWQFADIEKTSQTQEVVGSLADDTGILVRTSGTTAEAKIVAWSQASFLLSVGVAAKWMGLTSSDRSLCVMPFSHLHSLLRSCLPGLLEGGSVVCCPGFDRLQILQWLETFQPTYMTGVSAIYQQMLNQVQETEWHHNNCSLRFLVSGSDSIDSETVLALHQTFKVEVREFYGMSEVSPMFAGTEKGKLAQQESHSLFALEPWTITCLDSNGEPVEQGEEGEIAARGGLINPTLKKLEQRNLTDFSGWFPTGDWGSLDETGGLQIMGRVDDRINRGGQKIAPKAVERILEQHPYVKRACVFGIPHEIFGQQVAAAIILHSDQTKIFKENELRAYVAGELPNYMVPEEILCVEAFPTNLVGKLDRQALVTLVQQKQIEAQQKRQGRYLANSFPEKRLREIYQELLQISEIDLEADFAALGGDSFQAMSLLIEIEDRFGTLLTPEQFLQHSSIEALAKLLTQSLVNSPMPPIRLIQEGDGKYPLFVSHSVSGITFYATKLAQYLPPSQTVYALNWQPPEEDISETSISLEQYASNFVEAMITCELEGGFCLIGHSFGAQLAFEIAQQLLSRGYEPAFVGLIDDEADLHKRRFGIKSRPADPQNINAYCKYLLHSYVPQAFPGDLTLLQAEIHNTDILADPYTGWKDICLGNVTRLTIPGNHISVMGESAIAQWAETLTQQLNQSRQLWELNQKDPNRLTQLQTNLETYQQQKEIIALTEARRAAKTGNLSEEISYYENALSLKSTQSYWVYRNLSHAYWQKGMKEKALETLNQSIAQEQIPIVGYEIMANWLRDLKREKAYEKTLAEVIQYDEDIAIVQKALGKLMLHPNFSQNLRSPNTEALQEVGLNRAIADFPNQQSVVRF